ncbi:hypothetical protein [Mucilaginibacter antarcticus]|uniref:Uncharacterized protein n=1 Tax=Mucilaginibacter antarcticus TaxID=1855725 RepID=A0ABW5XSR4_9SPHI
MQTINSFPLITGTFKIADAKSIINTLYNEKILYHNRQLMQILECNEGDVAEVEQKIAELEATRNAIAKFLLIGKNDTLVQVKSEIQINFYSPESK